MPADELNLRQQYDSALRMLDDAREQCFDAKGHFRVMIRDPNTGDAIPNPFIPEWHRLLNLVRELSRELGMPEPEEDGPLLSATKHGDLSAQLDALLLVIADGIDKTQGHGLAALSRIYLDTIREKREANGYQPDGGVASAIISRKANPNARRLSVVQ